ncbi:zf-HC2 domain-containing protein [Corallococcus sp. H22C18031201]|nr:zf-HC2 domain-containing protein [Corallococcus sp. H22C18031201]
MKAQNPHAHEDRLLDFAYGELPSTEAQALEAHLQGCVRCARALEDIRGVRVTMAQLSDEPAPDAGLESLLAYANQAARRAAAGPEPKPSRWRRWLLPVAGLAAVGTLGILSITVNENLNLAPAMKAADVVGAKSPGTAPEVSAPSALEAKAEAAPAPAAAPLADDLPLDKAPKRRDRGAYPERSVEWMNAGSGGGLDTRASKLAPAKKQLADFGQKERPPPPPPPAQTVAVAAEPQPVAQAVAGPRYDDLAKEERSSLRLGGASRAREVADEAEASDGLMANAPSAAAPAGRAPAEAPKPVATSKSVSKAAPAASRAAVEEDAPRSAVGGALAGMADQAPSPTPASPPALSWQDLSRQAQAAASQGDDLRELRFLREALSAGAPRTERVRILNRLCELESALGQDSAADESCNRALAEAPNSRAAEVALRKMKKRSVSQPAPASAAPALPRTEPPNGGAR